MRRGAVFMAAVGVTAVLFSCTEPREAKGEAAVQALAAKPAPRGAASPAVSPLSAEDQQLFRDAAKSAWRFLDANYQPATGLVSATPDWHYTTIWDVGAQLLAFVSAKELGLIAPAEYQKRMQTALNTLERLPLYRKAAFNKTYSTRDGSMGDGNGAARNGWSATDLGRFLVALKVVAAHEPQFAAQAQRIAHRMDFEQIIKDGYIHGQMIGSRGQPWSYQEGRIGYEQYIAHGFDLWGARASNALDLGKNAQPVKVLGVPLLADRRKLDRLTSEPFVLMGLELGYTPELKQLAENVLKVQEARYRQNGRVTIVSEDAVAVKPYYFYYYCIYCNGRSFVVDVSQPGTMLSDPRWVSTKATFGWHALMPGEYTQLAVKRVSAANDVKRGWASGVYEDSGKSTATYDINTSAVVLEAAAYALRGRRPLIQP